MSEDLSIGRILSEKKYVSTGLISEKTDILYAELNEERKQPPVVILEQAILYIIFILYLCLRIIGTSDQFMNFPSQIFFNNINHGYRAVILKKYSFWLLPFYMIVPTYFYCEKVRRTMRTAIVSNLLDWFCKHIEKVRNSQPAILVLNWIKHSFSLWVSLKVLQNPWKNTCARVSF